MLQPVPAITGLDMLHNGSSCACPLADINVTDALRYKSFYLSSRIISYFRGRALLSSCVGSVNKFVSMVLRARLPRKVHGINAPKMPVTAGVRRVIIRAWRFSVNPPTSLSGDDNPNTINCGPPVAAASPSVRPVQTRFFVERKNFGDKKRGSRVPVHPPKCRAPMSLPSVPMPVAEPLSFNSVAASVYGTFFHSAQLLKPSA